MWQGMLTQEPRPDRKYKLNISLFLILLHPLDYLIYAKDIMIIVLLCKRWRVGKVGGGSFMLGFRCRDWQWLSCLFQFFALFLQCC